MERKTESPLIRSSFINEAEETQSKNQASVVREGLEVSRPERIQLKISTMESSKLTSKISVTDARYLRWWFKWCFYSLHLFIFVVLWGINFRFGKNLPQRSAYKYEYNRDNLGWKYNSINNKMLGESSQKSIKKSLTKSFIKSLTFYMI